jgi:hypothetical protein
VAAAFFVAAGAAAAEPAPSGPPRLGVMMDGGVPDGVVLSVVVSPVGFARLHAGLAHNAISPGVRAGVTLVPQSWRVSPALAAEAGHYREGDAAPAARRVSGHARLSSPMLERVGYDYAAARAGFEVRAGPTRLYVLGGLSYVRATLYGAGEALHGASGEGPRLELRDDPELRALVPSARAGLLINF